MIINDQGFPVDSDVHSDLPGRIVINGPGVRIRIGRDVQASAGFNANLGPGCSLIIGNACVLAALTVEARDRGVVELEDSVAFVNATGLYLPEPATIIIGRGCLFATETAVFTSDFHSILHAGTGRRLNHARDVIIGPEVWFGQRATVLKGARIGPQSIIGFGAVVSGEVPANSVAAGNPARVVRRGVRWVHALTE